MDDRTEAALALAGHVVTYCAISAGMKQLAGFIRQCDQKTTAPKAIEPIDFASDAQQFKAAFGDVLAGLDRATTGLHIALGVSKTGAAVRAYGGSNANWRDWPALAKLPSQAIDEVYKEVDPATATPLAVAYLGMALRDACVELPPPRSSKKLRQRTITFGFADRAWSIGVMKPFKFDLKLPKKAKIPKSMIRQVAAAKSHVAWPRTSEPRDWLVCAAELACELPHRRDRMVSLSWIVRDLVDRDLSTDGQRYAAVLLKWAAQDPGVEQWWLCRAIVPLRLAIGDSAGAETFVKDQLEIAQRGEHKFVLDGLQDLAIDYGLAIDTGKLSAEQKSRIEFRSAENRAKTALKKGARGQAIALLRDAESQLTTMQTDEARYARESILELYAQIPSPPDLLRIFEQIPRDWRRVSVLGIGKALKRAGLGDRATEFAVDSIAELTEEASRDPPNAHHIVGMIRNAFELLLHLGQQRLAGERLTAIFEQADAWNVQGFGAFAASAYGDLAAIKAELHGLESAQALLQSALEQAQSETRGKWKGEALQAMVRLFASLGAWDDAIALVKTIRPKDAQRKGLAKLLARAERWDELAELLDAIDSPDNTFDLCRRFVEDMEPIRQSTE